MNPNDNRELKIKIIYGEENHYVLTVTPTTTIHELKEHLYDITKIPIEEQKLIYRGKVLENNKELLSYQVDDDCTIHLIHYDPSLKEEPDSDSDSETNSNFASSFLDFVTRSIAQFSSAIDRNLHTNNQNQNSNHSHENNQNTYISLSSNPQITTNEQYPLFHDYRMIHTHQLITNFCNSLKRPYLTKDDIYDIVMQYVDILVDVSSYVNHLVDEHYIHEDYLRTLPNAPSSAILSKFLDTTQMFIEFAQVNDLF